MTKKNLRALENSRKGVRAVGNTKLLSYQIIQVLTQFEKLSFELGYNIESTCKVHEEFFGGQVAWTWILV